MVKKIFIGLGIVVALLMGYVAIQPSDFRISREIRITTSPQVPFGMTNNLHKYNEWNPWAKVDPQAKMTYAGPESGVGASAAWDGNNDIGAGRMTIIESVSPTLVKMRLDFEKPMKGTNLAEFTFKPEGNQTLVTWTMSGHSAFIPKLICTLFMSMEKVVGGMFEKGLLDLKNQIENSPKK